MDQVQMQVQLMETLFSVPYLTVDAKGRVTAASTKTITLPAAPTLSGGTGATNDATVVGGVTVNGHAVTVNKKNFNSWF